MATEESTRTISRLHYANGLGRLTSQSELTQRDALLPPPVLSLSQWADKYAVLSAETSADAGKFKSFGYQDGMMDAVTDPTVQQVTVIKSARVGYTKMLDHVVGYYVHQDPSPILIVQPRVEDAEDYSKTEIAPMLRDTPVLAAIAGDLKAKDSSQKILKRMFRNGSSISFVGANSPGGFRRITARIIAFDEVDGYPVTGAGNEGDQIALGTKRSETFWNRKIIIGSTPTVKGASRIEKSWMESDQRRYHVPCPHCGHKQTLKWSNLKWAKDDEGEHRPDTAYFVCEGSGCIIEESDKPRMIAEGEWIADKPFKGHAGFHIWAAYSLFPNASWSSLVAEFLRVRHDPTLLRTFVNLVLGETWEEAAETVDATGLEGRVEPYDSQSIPQGVRLLVAGVDTQGDRLEMQVIGLGGGEEAWVVTHKVLHGDPSQQAVWKNLDEHLLSKFRTEDGRYLRIQAACLDTGGHHAAMVQAFCKSRKARRVWAIKGQAGPKPIWPPRASKTKTNERVFMVGVDSAKDAIYGRLRVKSPGPGYVHFPTDEAVNSDYFDQLTAEKVVTRFKNGIPYRVWDKPAGKRNEALDTFVYALAAFKSLRTKLDIVQRPVAQNDNEPVTAPEPQEAPQTPPLAAPIVQATPVPPRPVMPVQRRPMRRMSRSSYLG